MHDDYYLTSRRIINAIETAGMKPNGRPPSTKRRKQPHDNNAAQQGEDDDAQQAEDAEIEGEEVTTKSVDEGRHASKRAKTAEEKTSETTDLPVCSLKPGQGEEDGGYCAACYELA